MKVLLTGATGFVGRAVALRLLRDGHALHAWVRDERRARALLGPEVALHGTLEEALPGAEAVVNLAGEPLVGGRWTEARRRRLVASRVGVTDRLVETMAAQPAPPRVLLSASAIGLYGDRGDELLDEASRPGDDFLADLCRRWEQAASRARANGTRVALLRLGIVLGPGGGALEAMLPPFRAGLGAWLGPGRQAVSWIHLADLAELFAAALADERYEGPLNAVAPQPSTNRDFARALGAALGRPARLRVPALAARAALGEAASTLLFSQRVEPRRLRELGFRFAHPDLASALDDVVGAERRIAIVPTPAPPEAAYLHEHPPRYLLSTTTRLRAPLEQVFGFFSAAENLGAITPAPMAFGLEGPGPEMREGATMTLRLRIASVPLRWRTRIEHWEPNVRFVDAQQSGPYASWWHEHRFGGEDGRTIMEDRVFYAPPLGPLGKVANAAFVGSALRRIFAFRAFAIRLRFGSAE